jgi:putative radical SAM enzyme (TIGR03279 family)
MRAPRLPSRPPGGVVAALEPGGVGEAAGLRPGDRLLSINGQSLRDVVDARFYGAEDQLDLAVERAGARFSVRVERAFGQALGIDFQHPTFDVDIRRCANDCDFCFVKMNAPGMRPSLSVKDDDYRYSFLFDHFVTLTNLSRADWRRLEEQRLGPLYVSVHATEPDLRRRMLGCRRAPAILDQLQRLGELGIEVHTQVVLVPGVNDGVHLERTLADLLALAGEPVQSVGIVPVGLTRYHAGACRPYTAAESVGLLDQVAPWRRKARVETGCTFLYPSDEWYLVAGRDLPEAEEYDDFPQLENGVGMVRRLLDEWAELKVPLPEQGRMAGAATLACGMLIAPVLAPVVEEWSARTGVRLRLVPVRNEFFGPMTTVSGLLTGRDVVAALREQDLGDLVLLPRAMFTGRYGAGEAPPGVTLDDMSIGTIASRLGVRVEMAGTLAEAADLLDGMSPRH